MLGICNPTGSGPLAAEGEQRLNSSALFKEGPFVFALPRAFPPWLDEAPEGWSLVAVLPCSRCSEEVGEGGFLFPSNSLGLGLGELSADTVGELSLDGLRLLELPGEPVCL